MKKIIIIISFIIMICLFVAGCENESYIEENVINSDSSHSALKTSGNIDETIFSKCLYYPYATVNGKKYFLNSKHHLCCDTEDNEVWSEDQVTFIASCGNNVIFSELNVLKSSSIYCINKNGEIFKIRDEGVDYLICDDEYVYYVVPRSRNTSEAVHILFRMKPDGSEVKQIFVSEQVPYVKPYDDYLYFSITVGSLSNGIYRLPKKGIKVETVTNEWTTDGFYKGLYLENDKIYGIASKRNKLGYEYIGFVLDLSGELIYTVEGLDLSDYEW